MTGWESWQSTWTGASGPLPDVRATAEREARRHRRAIVTVLLLGAAGAMGATSAFAAPEGVVHAIGWGIVAFCTALGAGFLVIQRGAGPSRLAGPRDALGFLERRLRAEHRAAHLARWVYLAACVSGGIATQILYQEHGSPLPVRVMTLGCFVFGIALTFTSPWWFGRIARRRQAEIDQWRRWMDEQNL
jgi:hypothetical protein